MEAFVTYNNIPINYITDSFNVNKTYSHRTSPYVGSNGSNTSYVSRTGRVISFKSMCLSDETSSTGNVPRIQEYINLSETFSEQTAVLTSPSKSSINGNYILTDFKYSEDTTGNFTIDWKFTEQIKFNVTQKTFRVWNKAKTKSASKTSSMVDGLNANTKHLLKDCPILSKGSKNKKCVRYLQLFLQSQGYYTKEKVDGTYGDKTVNAVKKLQQKHSKKVLNRVKLKTNGKWDTDTRSYFQMYFNYPIEPKLTSGVKGFSNVKGSYTSGVKLKIPK